jgi:hypothetical protein
VFGKRASSSPSAASQGGGDGTYQQQPPYIRRLIDAMQTIFDGASKLADAHPNKPLLPLQISIMPSS